MVSLTDIRSVPRTVVARHRDLRITLRSSHLADRLSASALQCGRFMPLDFRKMQHFTDIVSARANDIMQKWIDFFVLHKSVKPERITRRLK